MNNNPESLKEVWEWKNEAYKEVADCPKLEDRVIKRLQIIKKIKISANKLKT